MKILEVIGEDKYVDQLDSDINSTIIAMMANDVDEISMDDFQKQLKGLGSVVDATALRSYLLKNGKIKYIFNFDLLTNTSRPLSTREMVVTANNSLLTSTKSAVKITTKNE